MWQNVWAGAYDGNSSLIAWCIHKVVWDCGCQVLMRGHSESRWTSEASARQMGQVRLAWEEQKTVRQGLNRLNVYLKYKIHTRD